MPDTALNCRILAVGTRGDLLLPQALAGLDVQWTTRPATNGLAHDLYILDSAAGTREVLGLYGRIRDKECNVAVIFLSTLRSQSPIEKNIAGDPAAFIAARDSATRVRQLVERVIESTHSRAMAARVEETRVVTENLNVRAEQLAERTRNWRRRLTSRQWLALRAESMKLFQQNGGTTAQFDQLWPGVCHEALRGAAPSEPG